MLELMVLSGRPQADLIPDDEFLSAIGEAYGVKDRYRFPFSYVVDKATMLPVEPILRYLTYCASTRSNAEVTIRNKAHACYELFLYLDERRINYLDISITTLLDYKEQLCGYVSLKTNRPLAPDFIKMRLHVARDFCVFHGILPKEEAVRVRGKPISGRPTSILVGQASALNVKTQTALIQYVSNKDLKKLLNALGSEPGNPTGRPARDWLLSFFCVTTGTRLSEALSLEKNQILQAMLEYKERSRTGRSHAQTEPLRLLLTKTKRLKPRLIDVPAGLVDMLVQYIDGEREEAVAIGRNHRRRAKDTTALFVNGSDCAPKYAGLPYRAKRAEEFFANRQKEIGLTRTVPRFDPETRRPIEEQKVNKHVIHHLRHTYAIMAWRAYEKLPEADRWIRIQQQLGHKSHEVTANTYLRAVKHQEGPARDAMTDVLKYLSSSSAS
jgi:integrase